MMPPISYFVDVWNGERYEPAFDGRAWAIPTSGEVLENEGERFCVERREFRVSSERGQFGSDDCEGDILAVVLCVRRIPRSNRERP